MRNAKEIIEARWPGWLSANTDDASAQVLELIAEGQREALEFAAQAAEIEDDGEEVARIMRAKMSELGVN